MASKTRTSTLVCRGRQTTAWRGCNVRQPKQNYVKIQIVCDIKEINSKWRTWQVQKIAKDYENTQQPPLPTVRERTPRLLRGMESPSRRPFCDKN